MVAYRRCGSTEIAQIRILLTVSGMTRAEIARRVGVSPPTVTYWARRECGPEPRSLPKPTAKSWKSVRSRRNLVKQLASEKVTQKHRTRRTHQGARAISTVLQRNHGIRASTTTIRRDLHALGWRYYARRPSAHRSPEDLKRRLAFARAYWRTRVERILMSDEKTFTCADATCKREWAPDRQSVTHHDNSTTAQDNVYVWGVIGHDFRHLVVIRKTKTAEKAARKRNDEERPARECFTSDTYINRCLKGKVVNHLREKTPEGWTRLLQQDGHRSHTSKAVYDYLDRKDCSYIADWPARSPDLNPIENLWAWLSRKVAEDAPQDADELEAAIWRHWNGMTNDFVNNYVHSFKSKCYRVVQRKGFSA